LIVLTLVAVSWIGELVWSTGWELRPATAASVPSCWPR
jgi:hypothetical protein